MIDLAHIPKCNLASPTWHPTGALAPCLDQTFDLLNFHPTLHTSGSLLAICYIGTDGSEFPASTAQPSHGLPHMQLTMPRQSLPLPPYGHHMALPTRALPHRNRSSSSTRQPSHNHPHICVAHPRTGLNLLHAVTQLRPDQWLLVVRTPLFPV